MDVKAAPERPEDVDMKEGETGSAATEGAAPGGGGASGTAGPPQSSGGTGRSGRGDGRDGDPCTVFLGGLPYDSDEGAIRKVFEEFGDVVSTKIMYDRNTGLPRGFGFVTFTTPDAAALAISEMDGQVVDGRTIRVSKVMRGLPGGPRKSNEDFGRWERGRGPERDRDGPGPSERDHRDFPDHRMAPPGRPVGRPPGRPFRSGPGSPGRYSPPPRHGYRPRSRSPDGESRMGEDRGRPRPRGPPPRPGPEDDYSYAEGDYYHDEREDRQPGNSRQGPPPNSSTRPLLQGRGPPGRPGDAAGPKTTTTDGDRVPSGMFTASGNVGLARASSGQAGSASGGPAGKATSDLQELRDRVETARGQRDDLSSKIAALEEALQSSNNNETSLKERIKSLEQAKNQAAAQLDHRSALYQKLVLALAKVQEAQDRAKEAEKELKAILRPLLPTIQDRLEGEDELKATLAAANGPVPGSEIPMALIGNSALEGQTAKEASGVNQKLNVSAAA